MQAGAPLWPHSWLSRIVLAWAVVGFSKGCTHVVDHCCGALDVAIEGDALDTGNVSEPEM